MRVAVRPTRAGMPPFIMVRIISFFSILARISVLASIPAINMRKTAPTEPKNNMAGVNSIMSRPNGPTMIPAASKATTYGR